jgi:hypothetical protein
MKRHAATTLVLAIATRLLATAADAPAPPAPTPLKGFDVFRFVKTRNIFDPDRRATSAATAGRSSALTTRANFINLTGTMVAEGRMFAFFSGSRPEYNKVIPVGDPIADFKITGITTTQVELERAGKQIVVVVGKQIPLEGSSAAVSVEPAADLNAPAPPPDAPAPDAPPADASKETKPAAPADAQSEIIRRMMERREKELSK